MSYLLQGELTDTPIGPIYFYASPQGVRRISLFPLGFLKPSPEINASYEAFHFLSQAMTQVNEYMAGKRKRFDLPLDLVGVSEFQSRVLQATQNILYGSVTTYAHIAAEIGKPLASRAVGSALARNPLLMLVPCHRVIGKNGALHGFAAPEGIETKEALLRLEGITINKGLVRLE